ncbi:MAG: hypothetical protein IPG81_27580 [Sandaracinaceae bacterium]|nr:hypothetical protein [Sandaracinaceae bacterium]
MAGTSLKESGTLVVPAEATLIAALACVPGHATRIERVRRRSMMRRHRPAGADRATARQAGTTSDGPGM